MGLIKKKLLVNKEIAVVQHMAILKAKLKSCHVKISNYVSTLLVVQPLEPALEKVIST